MAGLDLLGVNLSGAEFGGTAGKVGYNYTYPTHAEIDYYASKNLNVIRLPFRWERLQTTLDGPLDSAELSRIKDIVGYAATKGMSVVLDPHDFGTYNGNLIGSSQVPDSAFANFWGQLSSAFSTSSNVIFGLMNEPHTQSATTWLHSANAAIAAIRQTGATQEILVPGSYWDGGSSWTSSDNAKVVGTGVIDPLNNYAFEIHEYLDSDASGTHPNVVSTTIGVDRLKAVTAWAEQKGARLFLGEFGVSQDATSLTAMNNMLSFMSQHSDVWQGASYWGAGPWWGNYMYSIEPSQGVDKPQMTILEAYAPTPSPSQPLSTAPSLPPALPVPLPVVTLAMQTDTGASATDKITNVGVISGQSDPNAVVQLTIDGASISVTATADASGAWTKTLSGIGEGQHSVVASQTNAAGTGTATLTFTLDTTAPVPIILSAGGLVTAAAQTISGSAEAGSTVTVFDNGAAVGQPVQTASDGTWSAQVSLSVLGTNAITTNATDLAGNTGTSSTTTFVYDHPPVIASGGGGVTAVYVVAANSKQIATIQATDPDPSDAVTYSLLDSNGNAVAKTAGLGIDAKTGVLSFTSLPSAGLHSVTVMASDSHGGSAVQNVKVNVGAPSQSIALAGLAAQQQTFVFDSSQTLLFAHDFQAADQGSTVHSVLQLAHSLFNKANAGLSGSGMTSLLASHSLQLGTDTILFTDKRQYIDLQNVNRQTLLAHPNDVALV